jgi:phosphoglycerate kinase
MLKKITNLDLGAKIVLLRTDYNVPLVGKTINKYSSWRIKATFKTIRYLEKKKSKIIIVCHLGRPGGRVVEKLRIEPIARFLAKSLKRKLIIYNNQDSLYDKELKVITQRIYFMPTSRQGSRQFTGGVLQNMQAGDILMLENIRFHPGEQALSQVFAKKLSNLADVFVNDAFATAHRKNTSIVLIAKILPSAAGFLLQKEVKTLNNIKKNPRKPLIFIIGGAKAKTKTKLIQSFLSKADGILIGGVLANTILAAQGIAVGKSIIDKETAESINGLEITDIKIHLPVDVMASPTKDGKSRITFRPVGNVGKENMILDIGSDTILLFKTIIEKAKTIVWNGPMGYTEVKKFKHGTNEILEAIIKNKDAYKVIGGGESIALAYQHKVSQEIDFISTGGGSLLKFLAGEKLPGIEALKK